MEKTFEAVYENGLLRPLEALAISDMQHVLVTGSGVDSGLVCGCSHRLA